MAINFLHFYPISLIFYKKLPFFIINKNKRRLDKVEEIMSRVTSIDPSLFKGFSFSLLFSSRPFMTSHGSFVCKYFALIIGEMVSERRFGGHTEPGQVQGGHTGGHHPHHSGGVQI